MKAVLDRHLDRYPLLQAADIYKLLHQSVFGPGHIIRSREQARQHLVEEMSGLTRAADEEIESIDPAGLVVRVNLRPLVGHGAALDRLVDALVDSARLVRGAPAELRARLAAALDWCRQSLPAAADELAAIASQTEAAGFPACHHSKVYVKNYQPAYRVVLAKYCPFSRSA